MLFKGLDFLTLQNEFLPYDSESDFVLQKEVGEDCGFSFSHFKSNEDAGTYYTTLPPSPRLVGRTSPWRREKASFVKE